MKIYYFKIKGNGSANEDINFDFGYYVNCIIQSSSLQKAERAIIASLHDDDLALEEILHKGEF